VLCTKNYAKCKKCKNIPKHYFKTASLYTTFIFYFCFISISGSARNADKAKIENKSSIFLIHQFPFLQDLGFAQIL